MDDLSFNLPKLNAHRCRFFGVVSGNLWSRRERLKQAERSAAVGGDEWSERNSRSSISEERNSLGPETIERLVWQPNVDG